MMELSNLDVWRSIMGDSDDEESDFEGFTAEQLNKRDDESDIDLDVVVEDDRLMPNLESECDESAVKNSDDDDDYMLPGAVGPSQQEKKKKKASKQASEVVTNWASKKTKVNTKTFAGFDPQQDFEVGVHYELPVGSEPIDYFSLIVPEEFWIVLSTEINRYAAQRQEKKVDWHDTTPGEMKSFVYINFMFGIHHLLDAHIYWSTDPLLRASSVADLMSRNRINKLNMYFHINNSMDAVEKGQPGYDPLFKVRPLLDLVRQNSQAHYCPGRDIATDEAMIKFNGRLSFKQYIKGKPNPWGIKVWCSADPCTSYMLDFSAYLGRFQEPMPNGLGHHIVMKLAERYFDYGHHIFFENFFTSMPLAQELLKRGTYMCGTIPTNRKGWPKELTAAQVNKPKVGDIKFMQDGDMVGTLWKDKHVVSILSTNTSPEMGSAERRAPRGKKTVAVPRPVLVYNKNMDGVDLGDQLHSYYSVGRPSGKWWHYICWWLLQTAMVNSFIIYKYSNLPAQTKKGHRHIDYRLDVLRPMCRGNSVSQAGVTATNPLTLGITRLPGRKKNAMCVKRRRSEVKRGTVCRQCWLLHLLCSPL